MRPVETISGMGRRQIKENDGGSEFKYDKLYDILYMSQCTPSTIITKSKHKKN
jgi:hypothetical protein